jgi:hypothetical protein
MKAEPRRSVFLERKYLLINNKNKKRCLNYSFLIIPEFPYNGLG